MEEGEKRREYQRIKANKLRQVVNQSEENPDDQPAGSKSNLTTETIEEITPTGTDSIISNSSFRSTWAQEVEIEMEIEATRKAGQQKDARKMENGNLERERKEQRDRLEENNKIKEKEKAAARMEEQEIKKKIKIKKMGMKKLRRWFGDELETETESTDSDGTDDDTWNQVERKRINKLKKKKNEKNKRDKIATTSTKASHLLGLQPVHAETIQAYRVDKTYEEAKVLAARDYLASHLKFEKEELDAMQLNETMVSAKGDHTLYVAFSRIEDIREIHQRMAECRNPDLGTRNFILPGFFCRYMALSNKCKDCQNTGT